MARNMPKAPPMQILRELLRDAFRMREEGAPHARLARLLGAADGYMQALIDAGVAEEREVLQLVAEERCRANGPSSSELRSDAAAARAVA